MPTMRFRESQLLLLTMKLAKLLWYYMIYLQQYQMFQSSWYRWYKILVRYGEVSLSLSTLCLNGLPRSMKYPLCSRLINFPGSFVHTLSPGGPKISKWQCSGQKLFYSPLNSDSFSLSFFYSKVSFSFPTH